MADELIWILAPVCAVIALVYGSVGLGGGSAYVAALAVAGVPHDQVLLIALALNLVVASSATFQFAHGGHLRWRDLLPLTVTSAPIAFVAARVPLDRGTFHLVLGVMLLLAAIRMVAAPWLPHDPAATRTAPWWAMALAGIGLGLAAGFTGIGGGIYLGPILLLARLATPKQASALCGAIVVINSVFGLAGRLSTGIAMPWALFLPLAAAVAIGGPVGAWLGSRRLQPATVQATFGVLVLIVAIRLIWTAGS